MLGIFRKRSRQTADDAPLIGFFEGRNGERLTGWALDRHAPGTRAVITLAADGGLRRSTCADVYRADLQRAGYGDGHVAFSVPAAWFAGAHNVHALFGDGRELAGSPAMLTAAPGAERTIGSLRLRLDPPTAAGMSVSGSIYDAADPTRRCRVALRLRGRDHRTTRATLFRPDLTAHHVDSLHGFRLMLGGIEMMPKDRLELVDGDSGEILARLRN